MNSVKYKLYKMEEKSQNQAKRVFIFIYGFCFCLRF